MDRSWHFTYANAEAIRVSRLDVSLFPQRSMWELFPDLGEEVERHYREAMADGKPRQFHQFYLPFDLHVDVRLIPTGEGLAAHYRDVSEQWRAEARERAAVERMRLVLEATPDYIVTIGPDWRFTYANALALEFLGVPDLVGQDIFELFPGNRLEPYFSSYQRSMLERMETTFEAYQPAPLHTWFRVTAKPHLDGIIVFFSDVSERKLAELRESETARRLAQVLEVTSDAVFSLDREWRFTFLNREAQRMLGPASKLLGENIWQNFPLTVDTSVWTGYHRSMLEGAVSNMEVFHSGEPHGHFEVESRPAPDGIVVFFRDVTAERMQAQAIRQQRDLLATVQQTSRLATWQVNLRTREITFGEGSYAVYGRPLETLGSIGDFLADVEPADRERVQRESGHLVRTGGAFAAEFRVRTQSGGACWIESRGHVDVETDGTVYLRGIALDITERKLAEEALASTAADLARQQAESERQRLELEVLYQTAPVALALFDAVDYRFLKLNDQEAAILGMARNELLGRPVTEIAAIDDLDVLLERVRNGEVLNDQMLEGELTKSPGIRRAWSANYAPVYAENGSVRAIACAAIEVTRQKQAEAALIQSEKLAAVGRLASSISHEINNPLEAITNLLYLIAHDAALPETSKIYVHMAQSELARVSQIATQTLRFHRQAVRPTSVTPEELVGAVIRLYTGRLANSNITIQPRYATDRKILCFENDIRQVLNNLIANAIDAMRNGGRLIVRAHKSRNRVGEKVVEGVRITIADTGHGMSKTTLGRIFEPFFTTKDLNGTGLGLWISHGIVVRHQGRLAVRSSVSPAHHGTVFSLFLPCEETPPARTS